MVEPVRGARVLARRVLFVTLVSLFAGPAGARQWVDVTGRFRVEAELEEFENDVVLLKFVGRQSDPGPAQPAQRRRPHFRSAAGPRQLYH